MKKPHEKTEHPVGHAFDRAREPEEAWRQQQIAALTQEQAQEYDRRVQDEQKKLESETKRIEAQKPQRIVTEKQNLLSGKPAPELRPDSHMVQGQAMKQKKAGELAKASVEQKSNTEIERTANEAKQRLDGYLHHAERQRAGRGQKNQTASRNFNQKTQNRSDDALARAFEKAKRQKQSRQNTQEKDIRVQGVQDQARNRERGRN